MNSTGFDPKYLKGGDTPWIPFTPYNEKVGIKLLHVDQSRGEMVLLMRVPAGTYLGAHNHRGRVVLYTIKGGWRYMEHDWIRAKATSCTRPRARVTASRAKLARTRSCSSCSTARSNFSTRRARSPRSRTGARC